MLTIEQVKPFLQSPDRDIQDLAEDYFKSRTRPLLSADEWWAVFDATKLPEYLHFHEIMTSRQSTESIRHLIEVANRSPGPVDAPFRSERGLLSYLPLEALQEFSELLMAELTDPGHLTLIRDRLGVLQQSPDAVWADLEALAKQQKGKAYSEIPVELGDLEDALARQAEFVLPRAWKEVESVLLDPDDEFGWLPVFATTILGKLGHAPAIGLFIRTIEDLDDPTDDAAATQCCKALVRIGGPEVLCAVEAFYDRHPDLSFSELAASMSELRTDAAEDLLTRLMRRQTDDLEKTFYAYALLKMCPTRPDALDTIRQMVNEDRWDTTLADPLPMLVALCEMSGWSPDELPTWRELNVSDERKEQLKKRFDEHVFDNNPATLATIEKIRQLLQQADEKNVHELEDPDLSWADSPIPDLLPVRTPPKVGRNDPCPCGSGKKYKKCCLK